MRRSTCACSATRACGGARSPACESAHGFLQRRVAQRAAAQAHADARVRLRRLGRPRACGSASCSRTEEESAERELRATCHLHARAGARRDPRRPTSSSAPRTRTPTGTRSARSSRCSGCSPRSARTRSVHARDELPLPYEYRFIELRRARARAAGGPRASGRSSSWTAATSTASRPTSLKRDDAPHPQHRPPPRQHPLRDRQPRGAGRVVHGGDPVGPDGRARRRADAGDRRGALRRPRDRHRQVHVREHRPARPPDGGRADRRRASTSTRSTGALYEGVPTGKLQLLARGLSSVRALRRRPAHRDAAHARRLRLDGRGRELLRGRRGPSALGRGHGGRGARARAARRRRRRRPRRKVSLRATDDRVDVSRIARAAGRRRPPAGGGVLDRRSAIPSSSSSCGPRLPGSSELPAGDGVLLVDKPAGITSHDVVAQVRRRLGRGVKVGHAGTLDPFATGLLLVLVGPSHARAALPHGAAQALRDGRAPRLDVDAPATSKARSRRAACRPSRWRCPPAVCASARRRTRPSRWAAQRAYKLARRGRGGRAGRARGARSRASSCSGAGTSARRSRSSAPRARTCAR